MGAWLYPRLSGDLSRGCGGYSRRLAALAAGDELHRLVGNDQHGGVGVAGNDGRDRGCIDDPEPLDPADPHLGVEHAAGVAISGHATGADRVIDGLDEPPGMFGEIRIGHLVGTGKHLARDHRPQGLLPQDFTRATNAADRQAQVLRIGQIVRIDQGLILGIGGGELYRAARTRPGNAGIQCEPVAGLLVRMVLVQIDRRYAKLLNLRVAAKIVGIEKGARLDAVGRHRPATVEKIIRGRCASASSHDRARNSRMVRYKAPTTGVRCGPAGWHRRRQVDNGRNAMDFR